MGELQRRHKHAIDLRRLRGEDRSIVASKMWERSIDGATLNELVEEFDASRVAIKTLLEEHAAAETVARDVQRGVSIGVYRRSVKTLLEQWQQGIDEGTLSPKSINTTKIPEAIATLQGRIDKLTGVEAPQVSVSASGQTLKDLLYGATAEEEPDPQDVYEIEEEDIIDHDPDYSDLGEG